MNRYLNFIFLFIPCILPAWQTRANSEDNAVVNHSASAPIISFTNIDINDKTLNLSYEIRNESIQDVWIFVGYENVDVSAEVFMEKDGHTLLIRKRFEVPWMGGGEFAQGRYFQLRPGKTRTESMTLCVPVYPRSLFAPRRQTQGLECATRLAIELGYIAGNLPAMIHSILEKADKIGNKDKSPDDELIKVFFKGSLYYNKLSEKLIQRDEEILIPYTHQLFKGEQVVRNSVEDMRIPYEEKEYEPKRHPPDLTHCTHAEIRYQPSMLEYFFPYTGQKSLFTSDEIEFLLSKNTIIVEDQQALKAFVDEIMEGELVVNYVCEIGVAQVVCFRDDECMMSFPIYNDESFVIDMSDRFTYWDVFQGLRRITPQIRPFELRVQCATNLRNLWHRLRLNYKAEKTSPLPRVDSSEKADMLYPVPNGWCGSLVRACRTIKMGDEEIIGPHICPGTGQDKRNHAKSNYAMNPNCKYDSASDTVLLFETKTGWNQHGGPELFTFDNHDPKGGCVLLNDGTVKFIRTTEELRQLRWK